MHLTGTAERHRSIVDVHVILRRDGRVLMGRRANTGYGDGQLHLPSGHVEPGESVVDGVIREAAEEVWVDPAALPADVIPYPAAGVTASQRGIPFSLHGWPA